MWTLAGKECWPSGVFSFPETCNMAAAMETEQPGLEVFETTGCEEQVQREEQPKPEPFYVERHSWSQLRKLLTDTRKYHGYMMAKAPHDFTFVKKNDPEGPHSDRIYYLGKFAGSALPWLNSHCRGGLDLTVPLCAPDSLWLVPKCLGYSEIWVALREMNRKEAFKPSWRCIIFET